MNACCSIRFCRSICGRMKLFVPVFVVQNSANNGHRDQGEPEKYDEYDPATLATFGFLRSSGVLLGVRRWPARLTNAVS